MGNLDFIQQLYIAYYGRPADAAGLAYWAARADAEGGIDAVIEAFANSAESNVRFGEQTLEERVNTVFLQAFGRNATNAESVDAQAALEAGVSLGDVAINLVVNASGDDAATLANREAVANAFTSAVEQRGLTFGAEQVDAVVQLLADVNAGTDTTDYLATSAESVIASLPSNATDPEEPAEPDEPTSDPAEAVQIELSKGNAVFTIAEESTLENGVSSAAVSEADLAGYVDALDSLGGNGNFGNVITFQTGDETLELVTIDFVGESELRDVASTVGYNDFIDLALFNGALVTAETLGISEQEFFNGGIDIENFFGYDWPSDLEPASRADGQSFTFEIELFDALGIANLNEFMAASIV
ncbi:MAG: hypothetical protein XD36_0443 [Halomonas sp. 54_146]|nr:MULTISPECIES: DUF4214 domain-containing protein [unclassified Halomonas]KUJ89228.1 MAG: hypothetical protein XD36_0443 [Halomonas sp. 54_146]HAA46076.1 hypothetical protein [Halomonas sp.]